MISPSPPSLARVIVITRSAQIWSAVVDWLADDATSVIHCANLTCLKTEKRPDIVVLDRELLVEVEVTLRRIRRRWLTVTIVVVGAADDGEISRLLDAGADDVVTAGSPVLASRLHALARRARTVNAATRIAVGDMLFDREARRVWCAGREVELTRTEEALLDCLVWHSPRAVGIAALTDFVWGGEVTPAKRRLVRVYIGYLRAKLEASRHVAIITVRGVGYELAPR